MQYLAAAIAWIVSFFSQSAVRASAEFLAFRGLYIFLMVTVLPFVIVKLGTGLVGRLYDHASSQLGSGSFSPIILETTGLLGWLLDCFQVPYCFTVIMSAFAVKYSIKLFKLLVVWR